MRGRRRARALPQSASSACGGPIVIAITSPPSARAAPRRPPRRRSKRVEHQRHAFTTQRLGLLVELDRVGSRHLLDEANDLHSGSLYESCWRVLYDIHGNLPALEAVLADATRAGADRWLLGGDYGALAPWPARDDRAPARAAEHDLDPRERRALAREPPLDRPDGSRRDELMSGFGPDEGVAVLAPGAGRTRRRPLRPRLAALATSRASTPSRGEDDERLLDGVRDRTVVFGHSHIQFRRPGPNGTTS